MSRVPVSCFIIAKNEADRIGRTIESVREWVDEVIVVDSESSDHTVEVARDAGCRVVVQRWLGFGAQKRFAEDLCRNDWVLNIDADEIITPELKEQILNVFEDGEPSLVGFGMVVKLIYPNKAKPRPWARDNWYVRLYNRRVVRFRDSQVHDTVVTDGYEVGHLKGAIHHFSIRSFDDMKRKLDERMWLSAKHAKPGSRVSMAARFVFEYPMNFFKYYFVRRHFTGGLTGVRFASIQSWYRLVKVRRIWQQRPPAKPIASPPDNVEGENGRKKDNPSSSSDVKRVRRGGIERSRTIKPHPARRVPIATWR